VAEIEVRGLTKTFGRVTAVRDVSFTAPEGKVTGLNPAAAIAVALGWFAVIEGITGQLLGSALPRWLPFYASEALSRSNLSATARLLPQWGGGLMLLGYAAVFATAAVFTTLRRDVT
jgi:ABC-2 type transport system permease protein